MKKWKQVLMTSGILAMLSVIPAYAAGWQWIDSNNDNSGECYYFADDGTMLSGTTTPDGCTVNEQGAWIVDGVVQTKEMQAARPTPSKLVQNVMKTSQLDSFKYLLYTPKNATENMGLIVFLHGHGLGDKMSDLKKEGEFVYLREMAENNPSAYIVAPMLPSELDFGSKGMWPGIEDSVMELIESVANTYQIDRSRISIIGGSMGADSAIQIAADRPETFSCVVGIVPFHYNSPIAKWEDGWGEKFKTIPTWLFIEDEGDAKNMAATAQNDIIAAGGQAWIEVMKGADHNQAGTRAMSGARAGQYNIYDWMISTRKPAQ